MTFSQTNEFETAKSLLTQTEAVLGLAEAQALQEIQASAQIGDTDGIAAWTAVFDAIETLRKEPESLNELRDSSQNAKDQPIVGLILKGELAQGEHNFYSDVDVFRSAESLFRILGAFAPEYACCRISRLHMQGDDAGMQVWSDISATILKLRASATKRHPVHH